LRTVRSNSLAAITRRFGWPSQSWRRWWWSSLKLEVAELHGGSRHLEVHVFQRRHQQFCQKKVALGFVIRRHHIPRCTWGARRRQGLLVGLHEPRPKFSVFKIGSLSFPLFAGVVYASLQPLFLFPLRNVQIAFQHRDAFVMQNRDGFLPQRARQTLAPAHPKG